MRYDKYHHSLYNFFQAAREHDNEPRLQLCQVRMRLFTIYAMGNPTIIIKMMIATPTD